MTSHPRASSLGQRKALKIATQRTIEQEGGQEPAALVTRVGRQTLSDYCNTGSERHGDTYIPVDVLLDLVLSQRARGEVPELLREICRQAGGAFVPLPEPDAKRASLEEIQFAQGLYRVSEVQTAFFRALAEGLGAQAGLAALVPDLSAAIETLCALRSQITNTEKREAAE